MDCKDCTMVATVPFYDVEAERERHNSQTRWMTLCFCVVIIGFIACMLFCYMVNRDCLTKVEEINKYWLDYISQYDFSDYTYDYTQDSKGLNIIGDNNGVDCNGPEIGSSETNAETQGWSSSWENDTETP